MLKIIQIAPAIVSAVSEVYSFEDPTRGLGKFITGLRKLGFDKVISTMYGADLVTAEEADEFEERLKTGNLPIFTSCCPAWVKFVEHNKHELIKGLSTVISPHMLVSIYAKYYYSNKLKIDVKHIKSFSVMPCLIKPYEQKYECKYLNTRYIDQVYNFRQILDMLKSNNIDLNSLEPSDFDEPFDIASTGGRIFGATGGVAESLVSFLSSKYKFNANVSEFRNNNPFFAKEIDVSKTKLGLDKLVVAKVCGLPQVNKILEEIKQGKTYHIIEVMFCPLGCVSGAGQPLPFSKEKNYSRAEVLRKYASTIQNEIPNAFFNPNVKKTLELPYELRKALFHIPREEYLEGTK